MDETNAPEITDATHRITVPANVTTLIIETANGTLQMDIASGALKIAATGDLHLAATGKVTVEGGMGVSIATPSLVEIRSGIASVASVGPMNLTSSAILNITGALVNIN